MEKEYLYVGHYYDKDGNYLLKIGTTNDIKRRQADHTRNYKKASCGYQMSKNGKFEYDWYIKLSKYNTLRYEDRTRSKWQEENIGEYVRNDRFLCAEKPAEVEVTIRKTYKIFL